MLSCTCLTSHSFISFQVSIVSCTVFHGAPLSRQGSYDLESQDQNKEVSGEAAQPVPLAKLKLSMAVYGQKLDGRPPDERPTSSLRPSSEGTLN